MRQLVSMTVMELKLIKREPLSMVFVVLFPVVTVLVLGGSFPADDPGFGGAKPSDYYIAAYVAVVIAAVGLIMLPVHAAAYRERGVLRRFAAAGFPAWLFAATQVMTGLIYIVVGMCLVLITGKLTYGLPTVHDPAGAVLAIAIGSVIFIGIGVLVGSVATTARSAQGLGLLLFFPMFLLGGGGPPQDVMPEAMNTVSMMLPLTHVTRAIQDPWLNLASDTNYLLTSAGILVAVILLLWVRFFVQLPRRRVHALARG